MKKRTGAVLALLCLSLSLCACGGQRSAKLTAVSIYDLQKSMLEADDTLPEMLTVNSSAEDGEELFHYLSDLDYSKVAGYFLAYAADGMADEIAVIVTKDPKDAPEAEASLKRHVEGRLELYRNYEPEQVRRAEGAVIFSKDACAVLIISDRPEAARGAFEETLSGSQDAS